MFRARTLQYTIAVKFKAEKDEDSALLQLFRSRESQLPFDYYRYCLRNGLQYCYTSVETFGFRYFKMEIR